MAMADKAQTQQKGQPGRARNRSVGDCDITATGTVVHLENYGMVKVFQIISEDGTVELGYQRSGEG